MTMFEKRLGFTYQARAWPIGIYALACLGAAAAGCSDDDAKTTGGETSASTAGAREGAAGQASAGKGGSSSGTSLGEGQAAGAKSAGDKEDPSAAGATAEPQCGDGDTPEKGLQGDVNSGTVNCGLTLLSDIPGGGSAQGSGNCAYVRGAGNAPYAAGMLRAFSLADPRNPVQTDDEPGVGGSESMRAYTGEDRAILVSGRGVYDITDCEKIVKKGEIAWLSMNAQSGNYMRALGSHEIAISHNGKRVYSGLGFNVAYLDDLDKPDTWIVKDWSCELSKQSDFSVNVPNACDGPSHQDVGRQYSHSSDDNGDGTVWYGANQEGSASQMEPATARMVDISDRESVKILDTVHEFPGHSMNWWKTPDGREFIIGANEGLSRADSCAAYPRPKSLGNALDAYIVEVTGKKFGKPFPLTLAINKPENCAAAKASGSNATISEHSVYNKNGAALVMLEFGGAGLRIFDVRDGEHPKEVAYYNDGKGHTHSGVFTYDDKRGIVIASGRVATHVLVLQPQVIKALGLPTPTDPKYPYDK